MLITMRLTLREAETASHPATIFKLLRMAVRKPRPSWKWNFFEFHGIFLRVFWMLSLSTQLVIPSDFLEIKGANVVHTSCKFHLHLRNVKRFKWKVQIKSGWRCQGSPDDSYKLQMSLNQSTWDQMTLNKPK